MSASPEEVGLILHTACIKWAEANRAQRGVPVAIGQPYYLPDAILAALRAAGYVVERDWQPIETAPKTKRRILCFAPAAKGHYPPALQRVDRWSKEYNAFERMKPGHPYTRWRPLPAPPG